MYLFIPVYICGAETILILDEFAIYLQYFLIKWDEGIDYPQNNKETFS